MPAAILYAGPVERQDRHFEQVQKIEMPLTLWAVIEPVPYEPAAYAYESGLLVAHPLADEDSEQTFFIADSDYAIFEGRCPDCWQKHAAGECHFDRELEQC
jgi:hypothetical protein